MNKSELQSSLLDFVKSQAYIEAVTLLTAQRRLLQDDELKNSASELLQLMSLKKAIKNQSYKSALKILDELSNIAVLADVESLRTEVITLYSVQEKNFLEAVEAQRLKQAIQLAKKVQMPTIDYAESFYEFITNLDEKFIHLSPKDVCEHYEALNSKNRALGKLIFNYMSRALHAIYNQAASDFEKISFDQQSTQTGITVHKALRVIVEYLDYFPDMRQGKFLDFGLAVGESHVEKELLQYIAIRYIARVSKILKTDSIDSPRVYRLLSQVNTANSIKHEKAFKSELDGFIALLIAKTPLLIRHISTLARNENLLAAESLMRVVGSIVSFLEPSAYNKALLAADTALHKILTSSEGFSGCHTAMVNAVIIQCHTENPFKGCGTTEARNARVQQLLSFVSALLSRRRHQRYIKPISNILKMIESVSDQLSEDAQVEFKKLRAQLEREPSQDMSLKLDVLLLLSCHTKQNHSIDPEVFVGQLPKQYQDFFRSVSENSSELHALYNTQNFRQLHHEIQSLISPSLDHKVRQIISEVLDSLISNEQSKHLSDKTGYDFCSEPTFVEHLLSTESRGELQEASYKFQTVRVGLFKAQASYQPDHQAQSAAPASGSHGC